MSKTKSKYIDVRNFQQDEYPWLFIVGARSVGKAELDTNLILTNNGFKQFKDLTLNDYVYNENGSLVKIIGIYPQGKRDVYELTFRDGRKVTVSDNHLWETFNRRKTRIMRTTKELFDYKCKTEVWLQQNQPLDFKGQDHVCPPYVVGAMLGDGCRNSRIELAGIDDFIANRFCKELGAVGYYKGRQMYYFYTGEKHWNGRKAIFKSDILPKEARCYSYEKRIPKEYIYDSFKNRCDLIQGMIDTDGQVRKDGTMIFTSTSLGLCNDLIFLLRTLGCSGKVSSRESVRGKRRMVYDVTILANNEMRKKFVSLPRKKERLKNIKTRRDRIYLRSVEYKGKENVRCIEVDSPTHIYLTGRGLIPTHNTISSFVSLIEEFKETGKMGIYMRRYDTEIENTAVDLGLLERLTGTKLQRERVKINGVFTDCITVDGDPAIYMIALSVAGKYKSNAFPNISELIMDEFIDPAGRELKDETNKFLQFAMTVFRDMKSFKALFVANATNLFNNYFLDLEILPTGTVTRNKELGVKLVMYKTSEELDLERRQTTLAKLVERMEGQGNSSFDNKFSGNYDTFIRKIEGSAKYMGTYKLNNQEYGVYKNKECFVISHKFDPNHKNKRALTFEDVDEMYSLIGYEKYSILRGNFFNHRVFFSDVKTRTAFLKKFKKMSLYE